jgi:hypothetical protein
MKASSPWITYRTRFLVRAKQLTTSLTFTDVLGRQHSGRKGDYLVESCDSVLRIAPRQIFEDIYVPLLAGETPEPIATPPQPENLSLPDTRQRRTPATLLSPSSQTSSTRPQSPAQPALFLRLRRTRHKTLAPPWKSGASAACPERGQMGRVAHPKSIRALAPASARFVNRP